MKNKKPPPAPQAGGRFAGRGSPSTSLPAPLLSTALHAAMHPAGVLLVVCGLVLGATGDPSQGKRGPPHRPGAVSLTPNPVPKARSRGPHSSCLCGKQASAEGDWGGLGTGEVPSVPHGSRVCKYPREACHGPSTETAHRVAVRPFLFDGAPFLPLLLPCDLARGNLSLHPSSQARAEGRARGAATCRPGNEAQRG